MFADLKFKTMQHFVKRFEETIKRRWDKPALTEFRNYTLTYSQFAAEVRMIQLLYEAAGLKRGDKIAINARSSGNWGKVFMATVSGGYVAVELFNGFTPKDTQALVDHSDSRILFTEKAIAAKMDFSAMPKVQGVIDTHSGELLFSRGNFAEIFKRRYELLSKAYPEGLKPDDICFPETDMEDLCAIMYTSGSTGFPKGVMLSIRNFSSQVEYVPGIYPYREGDNYVSLLPYAHIFGLSFDLIMPICIGLHLVVLFVPPIPANLKPAMMQYKPKVFFSVPLVLGKMIENSIGEFISSKTGKAKLDDYENNPDFCQALNIILNQALGGNLEVFVTGGAAIPEHFETLLAKKLKLPFVTGYGMTESAPTITLGRLGDYKLKSCGKLVEGCVEGKWDSPDPENITGELLIRGNAVFKGYYKNDAATKAAFTEDGWFHTGDMGTMDKEGNVTLSGRCKSMLLGTNGQNIYPEEIEVVLNGLPFVAESLIVSRDEKLAALIVPNQDALGDAGTDAEGLKNLMTANISALNKIIPGYSQVASYELRYEPFAKTPKGSIKRFLYS